jgi:hypothetical protein
LPFRTRCYCHRNSLQPAKGIHIDERGNYANINGALGYRIIDNDNGKLNFLFLHQSTNGDIKFVQNSDPSNNTAYRMDNGGQLAYAYRFAQGTFKISGDIRIRLSITMAIRLGMNAFSTTNIKLWA